MLQDVGSYLRALWKHWKALVSGVGSIILSAISAYLKSPLPYWAFWVVAFVCFFVASFYTWRDQRGLKESQEYRSARELANLISELEDNLRKAFDPVSDRFFGGGSYMRPSTDSWKAVRNALRLDAGLREVLDRVYADVDRWLAIVDSGVKPGMGSPELNRIVAMLRAEIPTVLKELRKAQAM